MSDAPLPLVPGLVSVVLANYNGAAHLDECLRSLLTQTYPQVEIIVSDNSSTDDSRAVCERYDGVVFAPTGRNDGLGAAYNAGVRRSRGEFAFVANNDMSFAPDCLQRLVEAMGRWGERCFAADPMQYNWEGSRIIHYRPVLRPIARPRELLNQTFSVFPLLTQAQVPSDRDAIGYMANCGAMLMRRRMFDELGGFDEALFIDWEDVELCWRANRRGWDCIFAPAATLRHKWGGSTIEASRRSSAMARRLALSQQYNIMRFGLTHHDAANAVAFLAMRVAANVAYAARGRFAYAWAGAKALAKVVRTLPQILQRRRAVFSTAAVSNRELIRRFCTGESHFSDSWPAEAIRPPLESSSVAVSEAAGGGWVVDANR